MSINTRLRCRPPRGGHPDSEGGHEAHGTRDTVHPKEAYPASEGGPKVHGLYDIVLPMEAHPIVGVKEIQAEEEAWLHMTMNIFHCREDWVRTIKNGAALDRTQLSGAEDGGEEREKASTSILVRSL